MKLSNFLLNLIFLWIQKNENHQNSTVECSQIWRENRKISIFHWFVSKKPVLKRLFTNFIEKKGIFQFSRRKNENRPPCSVYISFRSSFIEVEALVYENNEKTRSLGARLPHGSWSQTIFRISRTNQSTVLLWRKNFFLAL